MGRNDDCGKVVSFRVELFLSGNQQSQHNVLPKTSKTCSVEHQFEL